MLAICTKRSKAEGHDGDVSSSSLVVIVFIMIIMMVDEEVAPGGNSFPRQKRCAL
jgi:hypothetical protein